MTYFQKNTKGSNNPHSLSVQYQNQFEANKSTTDTKKSDSKQSYLKAFKKYYIEKLLQKKMGNNDNIQNKPNKQNFCLHETKSHYEKNVDHTHQKSTKSIEKDKCSRITQSTRKSRERSTISNMSRSKIVNLVNSNDTELEEMLYSSISEVEREMLGSGDINELSRENKLLKHTIEKLKMILKDKLQVALKKNKQELTVMFDQYSSMIKKLLQDKEILTNQLETLKNKYVIDQSRWRKVEQTYQEKIKTIVQENTVQINNTKQQIQEFLDMIIQYEEQASQEKVQMEKLRQRLVDLQMENDHLKNQKQNSKQSYSQSDMSDAYEEQLQKYALKIENLLSMLEQLQKENQELNQFLKSCKCSKISSNKDLKESNNQSNSSLDIKRSFQQQLVQAQKDYIKQQLMLREVIRKKDECIDRLNLVIEQLRKSRYASVDKITQEALERQIALDAKK